MDGVYKDREEAGKLLAAELKKQHLTDSDSILLLALPRGGVPIAHEINQALGLPYEILVVRKIGHPHHAEYGIGALTEDGHCWLDPDAVAVTRLSPEAIKEVIREETLELERRKQVYRQNRELPPFTGKTIVIIDDGVATGVTARIAARFAKNRHAKKVILAAPVAPEGSVQILKKDFDQVILLQTPSFFYAVGQFYQRFNQVTDQEVLELQQLQRDRKSLRS